jgi:NAD(P)-dependent dehydrogenase (short-subunit alcohol dehydrogenase family)
VAAAAAWDRQPSRAYADSKLANLLFTAELQRRLIAARSGVLTNGAHPGLVAALTPSYVGVSATNGS